MFCVGMSLFVVIIHTIKFDTAVAPETARPRFSSMIGSDDLLAPSAHAHAGPCDARREGGFS
jgi:hypothetical protein